MHEDEAQVMIVADECSSSHVRSRELHCSCCSCGPCGDCEIIRVQVASAPVAPLLVREFANVNTDFLSACRITTLEQIVTYQTYRNHTPPPNQSLSNFAHTLSKLTLSIAPHLLYLHTHNTAIMVLFDEDPVTVNLPSPTIHPTQTTPLTLSLSS